MFSIELFVELIIRIDYCCFTNQFVFIAFGVIRKSLSRNHPGGIGHKIIILLYFKKLVFLKMVFRKTNFVCSIAQALSDTVISPSTVALLTWRGLTEIV